MVSNHLRVMMHNSHFIAVKLYILIPQKPLQMVPKPNIYNYTFEIIKNIVNDIFTVTDPQLIDCMKFYAERMKIIVEPTGCLSYAAALANKERLQGKRVGIIVSGGNVDIHHFAQLIS